MPMRPSDREQSPPEDPRGFEQWLLDSARTDELPVDVSAAWARFGASLASVSGLAASGTAATGASGLGAVGVGGGVGALRAAAVKWLIVGGIFGSTLTALIIGRGFVGQKRASAPTANLTAALSAPAPVVSVSASPMESVSPPLLAPQGQELRIAPPRMAARPSRGGAPSLSGLGAQVALLDAARAAVAAGAFSEALRATDRFQRVFAKGELAPDAEVVAIEALAALGERAALSARADRFLALYPADPQAARVKALAER
jgi:hypothetical protein